MWRKLKHPDQLVFWIVISPCLIVYTKLEQILQESSICPVSSLNWNIIFCFSLKIAKSKIIHMICEDTNIITVKFKPHKGEELEKTAMLTKVQMFITQFDSD